jgi:predicted nuclease with TOPRIM domain
MFLTDGALYEEPNDRWDEMAGRLEQIKERTTMTFLDVRQLEGQATRLEGRLDRLENKVDRQGRRLEELNGKLDEVMRHLGIRKR